MAKRAAPQPLSGEAEDHAKTLARRARWLEQRVATLDKDRSGAKHDAKEHAALVWALGAVGAGYEPGPYAGGAEEAGETPPIRPSEETWSPSPDRLPRGRRYFPGGEL